MRAITVLLSVLPLMILGPASTGAEAHLVVDHSSGRVLAEKDADSARPIASLTKLAASLVLLEWMEEGIMDASRHTVTVPAGALRGGANPLALRAGDEISLETGLFAAMMASDNTSVHAMAAAVGALMDPGAEDGVKVFVQRMNALAGRLGMESTRFVNPHGLDEGGESGISTARDLARLMQAAYQREDLAPYASEKERGVTVRRGGEVRRVTLTNTNELVGSRGIDGTKTGTTRRAGPCLLVSATRELRPAGGATLRRLHVVVLNSEDRFRDAVLLLDQGWAALASDPDGAGPAAPKGDLRPGLK